MIIRYNSFSRHLKNKFKKKVVKICVDAGFTCPNRDGTKGHGGCVYCNELGSGANYIKKNLTIHNQIDTRLKDLYYTPDIQTLIIYFQAFSNTYGSIEDLKVLYNSALNYPNVCGIMIGTRPDCVDDEILDLIGDLSRDNYLWLEFGAESIHNVTLQNINRKHSFEDLLKSYYMAKKRNINICLHVIIGLPGETKEMILKTAKTISALKPDGIKIHSLYIEKGTKLYNMYEKAPWKLLTEDEYIDIVSEFLEYLPKTTLIQRLVGEGIPERVFAPEWSSDKNNVLLNINRKLISKKSFQGTRHSEVETTS